ncbi:MAG: T9SS type A sorting domain-containing protein, partial [Bacteroidales bacterium]|nr:T9SS type A sorting domain-containing protein [Bacteroidales bacterium]
DTALYYIWQESTDGGSTWTGLSDGGVYSGTLTSNLTIMGVPLSMDQNKYRCQIYGSCYYLISSNEVLLTVITQIFTCGDTLIDIRDSNSYATVQIGPQCWMAENLAFLPFVSPSSLGSTTAPYYYVNGYEGGNVTEAKATANYQTYGVLYNWNAAMNGQSFSNSLPSGVQGICPHSWHLPSDEEFKILEGEADSQYGYPDPEWDQQGYRGYDVGGNLKETGTVHWLTPNTGATNSSGFTLLPGGIRGSTGGFSSVGNYSSLWTSSGENRHIYYHSEQVYRDYTGGNTKGLSLRCLRDSCTSPPQSNAGPDQNIFFNTSATLTGSATGGVQPFSWNWSPSGMISGSASIQNPTTVPLTNPQTFTVIVTDPYGCTSSDNITINIIGGQLSVNATATPDTLCPGGMGIVNANASGGSGAYTYSWVSNPLGFISTQQNPIVTPIFTTMYTVTINDGYNTVTDSITVVVNSLTFANAGPDNTITHNTSTILNGSSNGGTPPYSWNWSPASKLNNPNLQNPTTTILTLNQTYTLTVTDANGCSDTDDVLITVTETDKVDVGIFNTGCAEFEIRLKPNYNIPNNFITNLQFTVRWPENTVNVINTVSGFGLMPQTSGTSGGYNYQIFASAGGTAINWTSGQEYVVLTFNHDESSSGVGDFEIVNDSWTSNNNGDYYLEILGADKTGDNYHNAMSVYLGSCGIEVNVTTLLQGPYSNNGMMNTDLVDSITNNQPYQNSPWLYQGQEYLNSVPQNMVDWVLLELRDSSDYNIVNNTKAGVLLSDGTIKDTNLINGVVFENVSDGYYYFLVRHRNHIPVMTKDPIYIFNQVIVDFTDPSLTNIFGDTLGQIELEPSIWGMITGDINKDGRLKYSGPANDRGPILQRIVSITGSTSITQSTFGYYSEDLNLNLEVKYSGPNNDPSMIIQNIINLTNSTFITAVFNSPMSFLYPIPNKSSRNDGPIDISLEEDKESVEVVISTKEVIYEGMIDNIQFTLSWDKNKNYIGQILNNHSSDFKIIPQGSSFENENKVYQVFAMTNLEQLPAIFDIHDKITILRFVKNNSKEHIADKLNICNDNNAKDQNGEYYISVYGWDKTGKITIQENLNINRNTFINIYPNPVHNGKLNIEYSSDKNSNLTVEVYDMFSRKIIQRQFNYEKGNIELYNLNFEEFSKGTYILKISDGRINNYEKVINY